MKVIAILWFLMKVILYLLAGIMVLVMGLLCIKTGMEVRGTDGKLSVDVRYGVIKVPVFKPVPQAEAQKISKDTEKSKFSVTLEEMQELDMITLILDILSEFAGKLEVRQLRARLIVGTDDAAKTGILYGTLSTMLGMMQPFLLNYFYIKHEQITLDVDFDAKKIAWAVHAYVLVRPISVLYIACKHRKALMKVYRTIKKKVEAIEHEPTSNY